MSKKDIRHRAIHAFTHRTVSQSVKPPDRNFHPDPLLKFFEKSWTVQK